MLTEGCAATLVHYQAQYRSGVRLSAALLANLVGLGKKTKVRVLEEPKIPLSLHTLKLSSYCTSTVWCLEAASLAL